MSRRLISSAVGWRRKGSLAAWQTAPYLSIFIFCSVDQVQREPHFLDWLGKGGWQANRIGSEVTRRSLAGTAGPANFLTARAALVLCDGLEPQLEGLLLLLSPT